MSLSDPISDMICSIKNAQAVNKESTVTPASKVKKGILSVLQQEGYIRSFEVIEKDSHPFIKINIKYYRNQPVIEMIKRVSKPGLRQYRGKDDLPRVDAGFGTAIVSTSQGIMTDKSARAAQIGGELLCVVK
ncbi:30S ribosomal protein S8 [Marinicella sp. S1101]|uniref:30S ribosomal protein S8 n=1 Tax=Marinicella marina TaxID=2996016 RepID=UPI002260894D|nr:30S ribosomal protein S8 [Marinicella marina]MCX7555102.1 30S ribosomal protein S8 [Marinicella marina]MDJ1140311.1 30S ribosomal protein S8 [Marinicella marina]